MLRRFLNRNDSNTPQSQGGETTGTGPVGNASAGQEAQGFICPICMKSYPNPDVLQRHFDTEHGDLTQPPGAQPSNSQPMGFICPICQTNLPGHSELQSHYEQVHVHGQNQTSRPTFSTPSVLHPPSAAGGQDSEELEMFKQQLKASEESRMLLASEVILLRDQFSELRESSDAVKTEKHNLEQSAARLAGDIVGAQAMADECSGQKAALEDHIITLKQQLDEKSRYVQSLESQLSHRPAADDVLVLRRELINSQTIMDKLTQERERAKVMLEEENRLLQHDVETLRSHTSSSALELEKQISVKDDLLKEQVDHITELKMVIRAKNSALANKIKIIEEIEETNKERELTFNKQKDELHIIMKNLSERDETIEQRNLEIKNLKVDTEKKEGRTQAFQEDLNAKVKLTEDLREELGKLHSYLEQKENRLKAVEQKLEDSEEEVKMHKNTLKQQTQSTVTSVEQLQMSSNSLKVDNDQLSTKVTELKAKLDKANLEIEEKVQQVKDVKNDHSKLLESIATVKEKCNNKDAEMQRLATQISEEKQTATEEAKKSISSIEQELNKVKTDLQEKESDVTEVTKQLKHLQDLLQTECTNNEVLQVAIREKTAILEEENRKADERNEKFKAVEEELHSAQERTNKFEEERTQMIAEVEKGEGVATAINQLKEEKDSLQGRLQEASSKLQTSAAEWQEVKDSLHKQLQEEKSHKLTAEDQCKKLEGTITSKTAQIEELQNKMSALENKMKERVEALETSAVELKNTNEETSNKLKQSIESLKVTEQQLAQSVEALEKSAVELKNTNEETSNKLKQSTESLKVTEQQLAQSVEHQKNLDDKLKENEKLNQHLQELQKTQKETEKILNKSIDDLTKEKTSLDEKVNKLQQTENSIQAILQDDIRDIPLVKKVKDLLSAKVERTELINALEKDNTELVCEINTLKSQMSALNEKKIVLEDRVSGLDQAIGTMRQQLEQQETHFTKLLEDKSSDEDVAKEQLQQREEELKQMQHQLGNKMELCQTLEEEVVDLRQKHSELNTEHREYESNQMSALQDVNQSKTDLEENIVQLGSEIERHKSTNASLKDEKANVEKRLQDSEEEQEKLLVQINKLKKDMENMGQDQSAKLQVEQEYQNYKTAALQLQEMLREENSNFQTKLDVEQKTKAALQTQHEEYKSKSELQLITLNENLGTLRGDITRLQSQLQETETASDELRGNKLEVEAKLENNQDDRRLLLERCLQCEGQCDQLQSNNLDLRRKLDDCQAALQELGRENQSLQIIASKAQGRKWASDSDTISCQACMKNFTVTVRKHHCRHCGGIFCNDCSQKSATTPASKKPMRVCESCYTELSQR